MGGHRHSRTVVTQTVQCLQHLGDANRVESGGGFVKEKQIRAHGDGTGDSNPLAFTIGQLVRGTLGKMAGPEQLQGLGDAIAHLRHVQPHVHRAEGDVLAHVSAEELVVGVLEDELNRPTVLTKLGAPVTEHGATPLDLALDGFEGA